MRFYKILQKVGEILRDVGGISKILGKSLRVLEDFQRMSEDALLLEVVRKEQGDGYLFHRKPKSVIINS